MQRAKEPADDWVGCQLSSAYMPINHWGCYQPKNGGCWWSKMKSSVLGKKSQDTNKITYCQLAIVKVNTTSSLSCLTQPLGIWHDLWNAFFSWLPCSHSLLLFLPSHWPFSFSLTLNKCWLFPFQSNPIQSVSKFCQLHFQNRSRVYPFLSISTATTMICYR